MNLKKIFKKNKINKIMHFMRKDKKNIDKNMNLILLKKIGKTTKPNSLAIKSNEVKKFFIRALKLN